MSKRCRACGQTISEELIAMRKRLKGLNVRAGLKRAKASGVRIGPPLKQVDLKTLKALRAAGYSIAKISKIMGISQHLVWTRTKPVPQGEEK